MGIEIFQDHVWALDPAKLEEVNAFLVERAEGRLPEAAGAVRGRAGQRALETVEVLDGVAVLPVFGVIFKRANLLSNYSGGTSTQLLHRNLQQALDDPAVKGVVLQIDSPGGSIDGIPELSDFIFESRGRKPIITYVDGRMCSGAVWIGTSADKVYGYMSGAVGGIGVAATHYDLSKRDEQAGIKRTEIYAGRYKRMGRDTKPLSTEGREYLQSLVDYHYGLFVGAVARNLGVSIDRALAMADGKVFIGQQAVSAGLLNGLASFDDALTVARGGSLPVHGRKELQMSVSTTTRQGGTTFESALATILRENPGMKRSEALSLCVKNHPDLHKEYLDRVNREFKARRGAANG
jgi:capsid assembly protease